MKTKMACVFFCLWYWAPSAYAQNCEAPYAVAPGDSLSVIAARFFKNAFLWTEIYALNDAKIGPDPDRIEVGLVLRLPCQESTRKTPPQDSAADIELLTPKDEPSGADQASAPRFVRMMTGPSLAPFVDAKRKGGGLITEIIAAASQVAWGQEKTLFARQPQWNDLQEAVRNRARADVIFPVFVQNCEGKASGNCASLKVSDPMFEMLVLLFVRVQEPIPLESAADLVGRRVCAPDGPTINLSDRDGNAWLDPETVTVLSGHSVAECFDLLSQGEVDGVVVNEFTGRLVARAQGYRQGTVALKQSPLAIVTLNAAVSAHSPDAETILAAFNSGLKTLRDTGQFQEILTEHMTDVWAGF